MSGCILAMPAGRGSSSSSSILVEAVRAGTAPAAVILAEPDAIVALGAIVADELYGSSVPVVALGAEAFGHLRTGVEARVVADPRRATVEVEER